jgi:hypothetical protein
LSFTVVVSIPLSTAFGCSSQAAAAIRTLSTSLMSRPAANTCRKQASEKETTRPDSFA